MSKSEDLNPSQENGNKELVRTKTLNEEIAEQLRTTGQYEGKLTEDDLPVLLSSLASAAVVRRLREAPKLPRRLKPERCQVVVERVEINGVVNVRSLIETPLTYVVCDFTLQNRSNGDRGIELKPNSLELGDWFTRFLLSRYGIPEMVTEVLEDPQELAMRELPGQLEELGYNDGIADVDFFIEEGDMLRVSIVGGNENLQ